MSLQLPRAGRAASPAPMEEATDRLPFLVMLLITVAVQAAVYAERPMASYRALALNAGGLEVGLVASSFALFSLVAAVPAGRWVDRLSTRPFVVLGSVVIGLASFVGRSAPSIGWLVLVQMMVGLGHLLFVVASQAFVAAGPSSHRHERVAAYTVAVSIGQVLGPAGAGLVTRWAGEIGAVFLFAGTLGFLAAALALTLREPDRLARMTWHLAVDPGRHHLSAGSRWTKDLLALLRRPGMAEAMVSSMVVLATIDIVVAYLPQYGEVRSIPVEVISALLAIRASLSIISRLGMGVLIRRFGDGSVLIGSMLASALSLALVPLFDGLVPLAVLMAVCGFGLGLGQPMSMAWVADRAPEEVRATALGLRLSGNRLAQLLMPVAVGTVAGRTGVDLVFWLMAALLAATSGYVGRRDLATRFAAVRRGHASSSR